MSKAMYQEMTYVGAIGHWVMVSQTSMELSQKEPAYALTNWEGNGAREYFDGARSWHKETMKSYCLIYVGVEDTGGYRNDSDGLF